MTPEKRNSVQFTRESADRIARVVRSAEVTPVRGRPLSFEPVFASKPSGSVFRICTFTGAWSINTDKTVTFKYQTSTPNTAVATNLFASLNGSTASTYNCAIARDGTAWFLIAAEC